MRKFQTMLMALMAVFAFSAIAASAASAEATLAAEWLAGAGKILTALNTESTGELLLEDTKAASSVLCKGIFAGTVTAAGADTTTVILSGAGVEVTLAKPLLGTGAGTSCIAVKGCAEGTTAQPIEVSPVGLPWKTQLILDETTGKFLDVVTAGANEVGYELKCLVVILVEDVCKAPSATVEIVNDATTGDAGIPAGAESEPLATCSIGGALSGKNVADSIAPILLESKELLTVSE